MFGWFTKKNDAPVWTVDLADIREIGLRDGLYKYEITWRKGPQAMTGTYAFPTAKPLAKVLALAKAEC
jgi:hypothetical protein